MLCTFDLLVDIGESERNHHHNESILHFEMSCDVESWRGFSTESRISLVILVLMENHIALDNAVLLESDEAGQSDFW